MKVVVAAASLLFFLFFVLAFMRYWWVSEVTLFNEDILRRMRRVVDSMHVLHVCVGTIRLRTVHAS